MLDKMENAIKLYTVFVGFICSPLFLVVYTIGTIWGISRGMFKMGSHGASDEDVAKLRDALK